MKNKTTFAEYDTNVVAFQKIYDSIPSNWKKIIRITIDNKKVEFESRLKDSTPKFILKNVPDRSREMKVFVEQYVSELKK